MSAPAGIIFPEGAGRHEEEEIRQSLRDRAKRSTYFFAKAVLSFADLTVHTHGPICRTLDSPSKRKLVVMPRDHLKTSIATIADTLRRIVVNPNIRILLGNETATNASHFLRRIAAVFDRNARFRWLFPELVEEPAQRTKWSENEILVPRTEDHPESTVEAIGVGGAVVSRHYDLIKLDDLVGKEASESDEIMRKTRDWYDYCESLLHHPIDSEIHVIGTRWTHNDLIRKIIDNEGEYFDQVITSAILPDGSPLWPERFTLEVLARIRAKIGSWKFSCQYLNSPHDPEATSFQSSWIKYYRRQGDICIGSDGATANVHQMRKYITVDPAISESDQACNSALVVSGVDHINRKWLLEIWAKRVQPMGLMDEIFKLSAAWEPEVVGIEGVAFQKALKFWITQEMERRNRFINIQELKTDTHQKKASRIRGLQPFFEGGEIYSLPKEASQGFRQFHDEYDAFPVGALVDVMDALGYAPQLWGVAEDPNAIPDEELEEIETRVEMTGRSMYTGY